MAKVTFSAIVTDIRGRLGSNVFSFNRGTHYLKAHNPNPYNPNTSSQQTVRASFQYYTGLWRDLSPTYKQMWRQYASNLPGHLIGHNVYLKHNLRLCAASHPELVAVSHPPLTPSTPIMPNDISVATTGPTSNLITWQQPSDTRNYVQLFYSLDWNYTASYNKYWALIQTVRSDVGSITHNHTYPSETLMFYKLRSICKTGSISPYTSQLSIETP